MTLESLVQKISSTLVDQVVEFLEVPAPLAQAWANGMWLQCGMAAASFSPHLILLSGLMWIVFQFEPIVIYSFSGLFVNKVLNLGLKYAIRQPRPQNPWKKGYGMPSDHAQFMGYFACFSFFLYGFLQRHRGEIPLPHRFVLLIPVVIAFFVCYSRAALGVHSTEQVVLGFLFGAFFAYAWYHLGVILYSHYDGLMQISHHKKDD
jgi:membrane-associated phospholipid phosphatase